MKRTIIPVAVTLSLASLALCALPAVAANPADMVTGGRPDGLSVVKAHRDRGTLSTMAADQLPQGAITLDEHRNHGDREHEHGDHGDHEHEHGDHGDHEHEHGDHGGHEQEHGDHGGHNGNNGGSH